MTARLLSIGPSHYCEKARWALQRAALPFHETFHPPPLHALQTRRVGGHRSVPVLVDGETTISDSTAILEHIQRHPAATWKPYPDDDAARAEVASLEDRFDEVLGPHVRRRAYFFLLDDRDKMMGALLHRVSRLEGALFTASFPAVRWMMRRSMRIDAAGAERSRARIQQVFDEVAERPEGFLVGDRFTAADLTLASLAAPLVLPDGYGAKLPDLDALDGPLREEVAHWRAHPTGQRVLALYAKERGA